MRILYLLGALEHPSMRGSLRHYHFLGELAPRHQVSLLALAKEGEEEVTPAALQEIGGMVERLEVFGARGPGRLGHSSGAGLLRRLRRSVAIRSAVRRMGGRVAELRSRESFDVAVCHRKELYPIIAGLEGLPLVMDACDATPLRRRAMLRRAGVADLPWALIRYLRAEWVERGLARRAGRLIYISPRDRDAALPGGREARVITNGVDPEYWRRTTPASDADRVVFTGVMDYPPNVDGATWLAREVLPLVRRARPGAELLVVGRDPAPEVRELDAELPYVTVTGYVEDMRPWLARGTVFGAGLRSASGQQNKVLEALAMEVPVVATPVVAAGLRLEGAAEPPVRVAGGPAGFARSIVELLEDGAARSRLARAGRRFVEEHFDWERSAAALESECRVAAGRVEEPATPPDGAGSRPPDRSRMSPGDGIRRLKALAEQECGRAGLPWWGGALLALLPFLVVAATGIAALDGKPAYKAIIREDGIAEVLQALAFLGVAGFSAMIGLRLHRARESALGWLFGLAALAAVFVVGEEISWGQRIFGWATPEELETLNRQGETNVHNISVVEDLFRWGKILVGAYGFTLPLLARSLDPVERLVERYAGPAPAGPGPISARTPGSSPDLLLIPPQFLATFFVFPFVWGLYRMFGPEPPAYEWAIAEFGEIVELHLALGMLLFVYFGYRSLRRSGDPRPGAVEAGEDGPALPPTTAASDRPAGPRAPLGALERSGVPYVLLRGHGEPSGARGDGEVDVLVPGRALPDLARELGRRGYVTLPRAGHEPHHFFVRYDRERDGWVKVDVVTDLLYGKKAFAHRHPAPDSVLRNRRRRGGVWVPAPKDEFIALLLHCLLDKGRVDGKHRERLASLRRECREEGTEGELAREVDGTLGPAIPWEGVTSALEDDEWPDLIRRAGPLRRRLLRNDPLGTAWRWMRSRALAVVRPLVAGLRQPGISVVLLGPDGAGKTTLASDLVESWPLPGRVVYMGTNRRANTVRLPGGDALADAGERLRSLPTRPARWLGKCLVSGTRVAEQILRAAVARTRLALGHMVVFDRFVYDGWRTPARSGLKGRIRPWLMEGPCPAPDLAVVLDAPADVLRGRQDEHPLEELRDQRSGYLDLARRLPVPVEVVRADRSAGEVRRDVLGAAWSRYAGREIVRGPATGRPDPAARPDGPAAAAR